MDAVAMDPATTCIVCGGRLTRAFPSMAAGFDVLACADCGARKTWPEPSDDELERAYSQAYYGDNNVRFLAPLEALTRIASERRAADVAGGADVGLALDVGCGRGVLLAALRARGFAPYGVEYSDTAARYAKDTLGLDVRTSLDDDSFKPGTFSLVVFWHSLEHLRDPGEALARAHELLKPGGRLVVAVPNSESWQARLFRDKWFHLDVPRHVHHFGASSLSRAVADHGFDVVEVRHMNLEQNPYGFLQSALNALGFDENLLYSMLKTPSARVHNIKEHPLQAALSLALAPSLAAASFAASFAETVAKKGGTIDLRARKRPA